MLGLLNFDTEYSFYGKDALAPDYRSRAFISNYQHLGFLDGNGTLVVMKPVRQILIYRGDSDVPETYVGSAPAPTDLAIAYWQHADKWREFLKPQNQKKTEKP